MQPRHNYSFVQFSHFFHAKERGSYCNYFLMAYGEWQIWHHFKGLTTILEIYRWSFDCFQNQLLTMQYFFPLIKHALNSAQNSERKNSEEELSLKNIRKVTPQHLLKNSPMIFLKKVPACAPPFVECGDCGRNVNLNKSFCALINIFTAQMLRKEGKVGSSSPRTSKPICKKEPLEEIRHAQGALPLADKPRRRNTRKTVTERMQINQYSMYECSATYVMDDMNSIALYGDRFYNLLKMKPKTNSGKIVKCKCSKSKCEARYCQCFSRGQICSSDCSCMDCQNILQQRHLLKGNATSMAEEGGCRCSKSECLKNYCDCFQKGETCSMKCRCKNCLNYL